MYVKGTRARTRVMKKMALKAWRIPSSPARIQYTSATQFFVIKNTSALQQVVAPLLMTIREHRHNAMSAVYYS